MKPGKGKAKANRKGSKNSKQNCGAEITSRSHTDRPCQTNVNHSSTVGEVSEKHIAKLTADEVLSVAPKSAVCDVRQLLAGSCDDADQLVDGEDYWIGESFDTLVQQCAGGSDFLFADEKEWLLPELPSVAGLDLSRLADCLSPLPAECRLGWHVTADFSRVECDLVTGCDRCRPATGDRVPSFERHMAGLTLKRCDLGDPDHGGQMCATTADTADLAAAAPAAAAATVDLTPTPAHTTATADESVLKSAVKSECELAPTDSLLDDDWLDSVLGDD